MRLEQEYFKWLFELAPKHNKLSIRFVLWEYKLLQKAYKYKPLKYRPSFKKINLDKICDLYYQKYKNNHNLIEAKAKLDKQIEEQKKVLKDKFSEIKQIRDKFLVGCFTTNYDSILMWSHYADNHRGVCIEFDIPDNEQELYSKVIYSETRPSNNLVQGIEKICGHLLGKGEIDMADKLFIKLMTEPYYTKSKNWSYENEYRLLFPEKDIVNNDRFYKDKFSDNVERIAYKMPTVKKVYLGAKLQSGCPEQYKQLLGLIKQKDIELIALSISEEKYKLNIPIQTGCACK